MVFKDGDIYFTSNAVLCQIPCLSLINSLPHNPDFQRRWNKGLLKTLWENEKMLVTSIFFFSHNLFYSSQNKFHFFQSHFILSSANAFNLDQSKISSFGEELELLSAIHGIKKTYFSLISVKFTEGRDLRNTGSNTGLLLSALCIQEGQLRKACLEGTVKLLLSDQLRDHQKSVAEEKGSPNATKVHYIKPSDNIYYTLTRHYSQQNPMLLVVIWIVSSRRFKWIPTT